MKKSSLSLQRQIDEAARHLADCKRRVGERRDALGQRLHARLTSPATLFYGAATGFLIGEFANRKRKAGVPKASRPASTRPASKSGSTRLDLILKIAVQLLGLLNLATAAGTPHPPRPSSGTRTAVDAVPTTGAAAQHVH